ncbi:hypothetical protein GGF46_000337 [Coemansia sp. RSA 552]|nr:hypothetical protein GGF46_000337 [Coemansia sp. RSA 552]
MGKRKDTRPDRDDRVDFIYVGSEFPTEQELRRQERQHSRMDQPVDAFKGGFTAGYFGTVGSKEGWEPSVEFVSSRGSRAKRQEMRIEDYMDAEDIADRRAAQQLTVTKEYASGGVREYPAGVREGVEGSVAGAVAERLSAELGAMQGRVNRVGDRVMAAMGWKPGQGIGPLQRNVGWDDSKPRLLPPHPVRLVSPESKIDCHGVGYGVDLSSFPAESKDVPSEPSLPMLGTLFERKAVQAGTAKKKKKKKVDKLRLSFGTFDDGEDEDSDSGLGGTQLQRLAAEKPSARVAASRGLGAGLPTRIRVDVCQDGRPALAGFTVALRIEPEAKYTNSVEVPDSYTGVRGAARSRWDAVPAAGGESQLCGRPDTAGRLVTAEDRMRLGVLEEPVKPVLPRVGVDAQTAREALSGFMPFEDDGEKQRLYREFLNAAVCGAGRPTSVTEGMGVEFARMACVFRPNATMLARFAAATNPATQPSGADSKELGGADMVGLKVVRRVMRDWAPSRILCKRMGVVPPATTAAESKQPQPRHVHGRRVCAEDFIRWDSGKDGEPLVLATIVEDKPMGEDPGRSDMALFRSIFGDD